MGYFCESYSNLKHGTVVWGHHVDQTNFKSFARTPSPVVTFHLSYNSPLPLIGAEPVTRKEMETGVMVTQHEQKQQMIILGGGSNEYRIIKH